MLFIEICYIITSWCLLDIDEFDLSFSFLGWQDFGRPDALFVSGFLQEAMCILMRFIVPQGGPTHNSGHFNR